MQLHRRTTKQKLQLAAAAVVVVTGVVVAVVVVGGGGGGGGGGEANAHISNFMKFVQWEPSCSIQTDRRPDKHDGINSRFSQLCERAK
jgi:hypothetical protein